MTLPHTQVIRLSALLLCTAGSYAAQERRSSSRDAASAVAVVCDERPQALVLLAAGGAAFEVGAEAGELAVCVTPGELELDVPVELLEALVAADLRVGGSEQAAERLPDVVVGHHGFSFRAAPGWNPCSARC